MQNTWFMIGFNVFGIALFYYTSAVYFTSNMGWTMMDSTVCATATVTVGLRGFIPPPLEQRYFMSAYHIFGWILYLSIFLSFLSFEYASTMNSIWSNRKKDIDFDISRSLKDRVLYPSLSLIVIIIVGSIFFSSNEGIAIRDALYFCVVFRASFGIPGNLHVII